MRLAALLALLSAAAPAAAQDDLADVTPAAVLSGTWAEALGGADAVAWALADVAAADSLGERPAGARATVVTAAAATSATLAAAFQFSVALAAPERRAETADRLGPEVVPLHEMLVMLAELAGEDAESAPDAAPTWSEWAAEVRAHAARLGETVDALGLRAP